MNEQHHKRIEPQLLRSWVYEALRGPFPTHKPQLDNVLTAVYNRACQQAYLERRLVGPGIPASFSITDIPDNVQNSVREVIWSLIIQGIIVPGVPNQVGNAGLPSFTITEWGKKCLSENEYLPYDASLYIEKLKSEIPTIDSDILLYLKESLCAFRSGVYLSSAVMTGVAAERTLLILRTAVEKALSSPARKQKFTTSTSDKPIKRVYDEIWKRIEPVQEQLAGNLGKEDVKAELSGIFDLIRKTRNDAGHPTGRVISRDEAFGILLLFPLYCKTAYGAMAWLISNPLP